MRHLERRHYRRLALEVFESTKDEKLKHARALQLAHDLKGTNPKFDAGRFIEACMTGRDLASSRAKEARIELKA